ncbi:MAG TPA: hypothetical protein DGT21_25645 [Armatimonadetes bacterium]|nr:hypothetical protein [Armatimonadota bacterium]
MVIMLVAAGAAVAAPGVDWYLEGVDVHDLVQDEGGTLWLATANGLYELPPGGTPSPVGGAEALRRPMYSIARERNGRMWLGTDEGLIMRTAEVVKPIPRIKVSHPGGHGGAVAAPPTEYTLPAVVALAASDRWLVAGTATSIVAIDLVTGKWMVDETYLAWGRFLGCLLGEPRAIGQCGDVRVDARGRVWSLLQGALVVFSPGQKDHWQTGYGVFEEGERPVSVSLNCFLDVLPHNSPLGDGEDGHERPPAITTDDTGETVVITRNGRVLREPPIPRGSQEPVIIESFTEVATAAWVAGLPAPPAAFALSGGRLAVVVPGVDGGHSAAYVGQAGAEQVTEYSLGEAAPHRIYPHVSGESWWVATSQGLAQI